MLAIVLLFLLAMAGLGMFGRLRPRLPPKPRAARCPRCGRHRIGGACGCRDGA